MGDVAAVAGRAGEALDAFGTLLVERLGALNLLAAALLVGALVLDRVLGRRVRASLRIALYAPVALRVVLPLSWRIGLGGGLASTPVLAPLLQLGAAPSAASLPHAHSWHALAAVVYLVVAALLVGRGVVARIRLRGALATALPFDARALGADVPCAVVRHDALGPMAVGMLAPRIVLPSRLLDGGETELLQCVLRHEAAHVRRGDAWLSAAMELLGAGAWPVLPVWIAIARVRQLIELACDDAALSGADARERRRYGHALLDLAARRSFTVAPIGGELHFGSILRARIEALPLRPRWPFAPQALAVSLASVALIVACGGSVKPAKAPVRQGYGYEFAPDSQAEVTAAPLPTDTRATGPEGRLTPELIQAYVRGHFGALLTCYDRGRARDPKLFGTVTVRYVIGEDGVPKDVIDESSTLPDKEVVGCAVGVFQKLRFEPSHRGEVTIVYPIQFGS